MIKRVFCVGLSLMGLFECVWAEVGKGLEISLQKTEHIRAAVAAVDALTKPKKERKILVFSREIGKYHSHSILHGQMALRLLGEKTGAYTATFSDDPRVFADSEKLSKFDAVVFNNPCGNVVSDLQQRTNLLTFVRHGGGFVGIHCAAHVTNWPEYTDMLGGFSVSHPWSLAFIKVDEPNHPLMRCFKQVTFAHQSEIYVFNSFSRERNRVLLSLDKTRTNMEVKGTPGKDADYPLSWINHYGEGRVFYCGLGHNEQSFEDAELLAYYLAGIQYAMCDMVVADTPWVMSEK